MTYEMQWTVRHFIHSSHKWRDEIVRQPDMAAGPRVYAERKCVMWQRMASAADKDFRTNNVDYKSPL